MDNIKPQSICVKTNEIVLKESGEWLYFFQPREIVIANKPEEVLPALREIDRMVETKGWYAAGFLSYEAASGFDPVLQVRSESEFPYLWFGLYPKPHPVSFPGPEQTEETPDWRPTIGREAYNAAIAQIKEDIAEGRTYQVNFTMRLQAGFAGDPWKFFLRLAQSQNQHAAYLDTGRFVICSASPELFFQLDGQTITCRPMKGTARRGRTTAEDQKQAEWLQNSEKNRAENVMIVDMLRNDLGRVADIGSVQVPKLFETERYPTLWQMTSTVTATTSASLPDIFHALFPCASITGAPKVSTMRIIAELENTPRRIYTGSIGYISPQRKAKFSVAIRSALIDREAQTAEYGVGGGIVWDSTSADEYAEALLKARVLLEKPREFSLLETMLWTPDEGFFLREKHLARLLDSADYFGIPTSLEVLESCLDQLSFKFRSARRVRVLVDQSGIVQLESKPHRQVEAERPLNVSLARNPVDSGNIFLFHKTTQREVYDSARKDFADSDDVLLYNELGELTEFTIGNLVVELGGKLFTPPISCGVLPGTFRAHLLETGQVAERIITVEQLGDCTKLFRVNSVRKWERVQIKRTSIIAVNSIVEDCDAGIT